MKIMQLDNEKALDAFADLLEPLTEILTDKEVKAAYDKDGLKIGVVKLAIKKHKKEVIQILAILDDTPVEKYKVNILTLPAKIIELLNTPEFSDLFTSQGQKSGETSSGSAMENTEDGAN